MTFKCLDLAWGLFAYLACAVSVGGVEPAVEKTAAGAPAQVSHLSIRVVDEQGMPIPGAKVTPWALRSSEGHGWWRDGDATMVSPKEVVTDMEGIASIAYPLYRNPPERVRTTAVSLIVDHADFAILDRLHVNVPRNSDEPHLIKLARGAPVEVRPLIEGKSIDLDQIFAIWSDRRSWVPGYAPEKLEGGVLRFAAMRPGRNSLLLVRLEGDRATHFSRIVDFNAKLDKPQQIDVPLKPAIRISGTFSENVPRPVRRGRISVRTLGPRRADDVDWHCWTTVAPDGAFVIDSWPEGEPIQIIGLCDGYIAESGAVPAIIDDPPPPGRDVNAGWFRYPQTFEADKSRSITISMLPLGRCVVTARDPEGKPASNLTVTSWPNVVWWNGGSQLYGSPLINMRHALRTRKYLDSADKSFPEPFRATTDAQGRATLELPAGGQLLHAESNTHELPIMGRERSVEVMIRPSESTEVVLPVQPRGTQRLGE